MTYRFMLFLYILLIVLSMSFCTGEEPATQKADSQAPGAAETPGMNIQTDCLINSGPCVREIEHDGIKVVFDIAPKPVSPMKELVFKVILSDRKGPVTDASVLVDLTMPGMFMGTNRSGLIHTEGGKYEGRGIIQACPHGGRTWMAEVRITRQEKTESVSFTFGVE